MTGKKTRRQNEDGRSCKIVVMLRMLTYNDEDPTSFLLTFPKTLPRNVATSNLASFVSCSQSTREKKIRRQATCGLFHSSLDVPLARM